MHGACNRSRQTTSPDCALTRTNWRRCAPWGKALQRFTDWLIDREWLAEVHEQHKDLLDAEGLSPDGLIDLLGRASTLGFAVSEPAGWRLLPAVCRYLDHFEGLATASRDDDNEAEAGPEDNADDVLNDEESD